MEDVETCPHCQAVLQGAEIPTESRRWYGGETHFTRTIGVEVRGVYDGVLFYMCPFCRGYWHRWPEGHYIYDLAAPYVNGEKES